LQLLTDFLQPGKVIFRKKEYGPEIITAGIESVARYLKDNLVSDSPFIYLFATNHIKTVFSYFGIIKARRICVIMDPKIGKLELSEMLLDTPPAACIRIDKATEIFDFAKEIEIRNQPWKDDSGEDLSDVCTMIYTAAEDGYAKGVMLTHENMLANARAIAEGNNVAPESITCALLPFYHSFGLQTGIITPLLNGGSTVVQNESDLFNSKISINNFLSCNITHLYSIPIVYYLLSKIKNIQKIIATTKSIISGGYSLTDKIYQKMHAQNNIQIQEGYGITEASPVCTWNFVGDKYKEGAIGRAIACCEVKIFSKQNSEASIGQEGEIFIKGSNIMKGYYRHPEATQNALAGGWLHSGDWGFKDKEGYIHFAGLKKRMINYGGKKVFPAEVERYIKLNTNVSEAEVFAKDDGISGQTVNAKIRLEKNTKTAQETFFKWCRENISEYKVPSKVDFI
jgi:long-chain acyl-CoA synthetase